MSWLGEYKKSLKMKEVEEVFDLFFYRPLAFLLVKLIYKTNITPNQLTIAAIFMGVIGGCFYAQGLPQYYIVGALFYMMFNILDCSDGQLARLKKNGTHTGRIIDGFADYIATTAVFIGIGIGFANMQSNPAYWWMLIVITGISNTVHAVLVDYYRTRFLDYVLDRKSTFEEELDDFKNEYIQIKGKKGKSFDRFIIGLYLKYNNIQSKLTANKKTDKSFKTTPQEYFKKNKTIIRFWIILGPTSQISTLIICSIINRFDVFFWIMILGFNLLALVLWIIQHQIDKSLNTNK